MPETKLVVSASPHIKSASNVRRIMLDVVIALLPALAAAVVFFGFAVLLNALFCVLFCGAAELLYTMVRRWKFNKKQLRESSIFDGSFAVTGLLLALNLPVLTRNTAADYQMRGVFDLGAVDWGNTILVTLLASVMAIVFVKMLFGGIGKNFANPAATGRIFVFLTFGSLLKNTNNLLLTGADAVTSATWLGSATPLAENANLLDFFLGLKNSAAVGEVCILALLAGYLYLSLRRVIDFRTPLLVIGSFAVCIFFFTGCKIRLVLPHCLSGGLFLGAIFMATDYASSPNTFPGTAVFAVGIGLLTALFRVFGSYPEGVSFAIVIMNVLTPLIDKWILPRPFGKKTGREERRQRERARREAELAAQKEGA